MRDALSLLDQAIAFGAGSVREAEVREMLGVVDAGWLVRILDALVAGEGRTLVDIADSMLTANAPFERALSDFAQLLQRIALAQVGALGDADDPQALQRFAQSIAAEDLQVYYQIVTHGARELALAPDAHTGFTMVLLRLLAFRPSSEPATSRTVDAAAAARGAANAGAAALSNGASAARATSPVAAPRAGSPVTPPRAASPSLERPAAPPVPRSAPAPAARAAVMQAEASSDSRAGPTSFDGDWPGLAARLDVSGFVRQFMEQSELLEADGLRLRVRVPIRPLAEPGTVRRVREALAAHFGADVRLDVEVGRVQGKTAAGVSAQERADRQAQAQAAIESDPFVRTLIDEFDGAIVPGSVRPRERRQTPGESE